MLLAQGIVLGVVSSLVGVLVTTVGVALVLRPPGRRTAERATMDP